MQHRVPSLPTYLGPVFGFEKRMKKFPGFFLELKKYPKISGIYSKMKKMKNFPEFIRDFSVLVMTLVIVLFSPSFICAFFVIFTMLSIDVGVIGWLALCGSELDPISAVTLLMSIGFSVNFTAHVTYRFFKSGETIKDRKERVQRSLHMIVWPSMQSAISTFLGVCMMGLVPSYMVRVFFQTTTLVISLGLFHALAVLPVAFSWLTV
jgi:predicted RND superfamily exporter protein